MNQSYVEVLTETKVQLEYLVKRLEPFENRARTTDMNIVLNLLRDALFNVSYDLGQIDPER